MYNAGRRSKASNLRYKKFLDILIIQFMKMFLCINIFLFGSAYKCIAVKEK